MRILLISFSFAPLNKISAIRSSKLCKYWVRQGHDVTILTAKNEDTCLHDPLLYSEEISSCKIIRTTYLSKNVIVALFSRKKKSADSISIQTKTNKNNKASFILAAINISKRYFENGSWYRMSIRPLKKLLKQNKYDMIFSTFGPIHSHRLGLLAKKMQPDAFWIADYRDLYGNLTYSDSFFKRSWINGIINRVGIKADAITCVSEGLKSALHNNKMRIPVSMITNGFDKEDLSHITEAGNPIEEKRIFTIAYTGQLYKGLSNASVIFRMIQEFHEEKRIDLDKIKFVYAGQQGGIARNLASSYGLESIVTDLGMVTRERAMAIQRNADALLLITWNYKEEQGIITGKLYEYMMQEKPIIALVNGDLAGSAIADIIKEYRLGMVWEQANDEIDYPELKKTFLDMYLCCINSKKPVFNPDKEAINKYSYEKIALEFINLATEPKG